MTDPATSSADHNFKMISYESFHNDLPGSVTVWWSIVGTGGIGGNEKYDQQWLRNGGHSTKNEMALGLAHQVCVRFRPPNPLVEGENARGYGRRFEKPRRSQSVFFPLSFTIRCKTVTAPAYQGCHQTHRVSDIAEGGIPQALTYESVHNDVQAAVVVWWVLKGPSKVFVRTADTPDSSEPELHCLEPNATSEPTELNFRTNHQVCIKYHNPKASAYQTKCQAFIAPRATGRHLTRRVSDIIGKIDFSNQTSSVSDAFPSNTVFSRGVPGSESCREDLPSPTMYALDLPGESAEYSSLGVFALASSVIVLVGLNKFCTLKRSALELQEAFIHI